MVAAKYGRCEQCKLGEVLEVYGSAGNQRPASICRNKSNCTLLVPDPPDALRKSYGDIAATLTEASASIIVRSEHQFTGHDDYRLTQRRHYRQQTSTPYAFIASDREVTPYEDQANLGEYIGFIDIRPEHVESPIAMALLTPPGYLRLDRANTIIVGDYGPIFGAHSFPCTVYCMHDPKEGGTVCAHACIMMALGMMLDRGASLDGPFALHYLAHVFREYVRSVIAERSQSTGEKQPNRSGDRSPISIPPDLLNPAFDVEDVLDGLGWKSAPTDLEIAQLPVANATHNDRKKASRPQPDLNFSRMCLGGASSLATRSFPLGGLDPWRDVRTLLHRFGVSEHATQWPPNVRINTDVLFLKLIEAYVVARFPVILFVNSFTLWKKYVPDGHAVVVVGISSSENFTKATLIIHDPGEKPFAVHAATLCLSAVMNYPLKQNEPGKRTCVLFLGDRGVGVHAIECIEDLVEGTWEARWEATSVLAGAGGNYCIRLVDKREIWNAYREHAMPAEQGDRLSTELPESRYWCIAATVNTNMRYVWLYDAHDSSARCLGRLRINLSSGRAWWWKHTSGEVVLYRPRPSHRHQQAEENN